MRRVDRYVTFDGEVHVDQKAALKHLDKMFTNAMYGLVGRLVNETNGKSTKIAEFLKDNLGQFEGLIKIKKDMEIEDDDE